MHSFRLLAVVMSLLFLIACGKLPPIASQASEPNGESAAEEVSTDAAVDEAGAYALGRELTEGFYKAELAPIRARFTDRMNAALTIEQFTGFQQKIAANLLPETEVISERVEKQESLWLYHRDVRYEKVPQVMEVMWAIDADGKVAGFFIRMPPKEAETRFLDYQTKTTLHLPFEGEWYVFWGGRTLSQNYHAIVVDQRFAYDFLIMKDGKSFSGDAKDNASYYAFGKRVLAPADGVVRMSSDGVVENIPGEMNSVNPMGNYVVVDHGNNEFSIIAHFKNGSLKVKTGDKVAAGQWLGDCGNSGHSSEAHIHYHLQNTPVPFKGEGLPAFFNTYTADGETTERGEPVKGQVVGQ